MITTTTSDPMLKRPGRRERALVGVELTTGLMALVGGGLLAARPDEALLKADLSALAGAGIVLFEGAELSWLGFQPLEAVFAAVGVAVLVLARGLPKGHRH